MSLPVPDRTDYYVDQFIADCEKRALSQAAISQYRWGLKKLEMYCPIMPRTEGEIVEALYAPNLSLESRRDLRKVYRRFFRWVKKRHGLEDPTADLDRLPKSRTLPRVLSLEEIDRLLAAADTERDELVLRVLLDSGVRIGELANMRKGDIQPGLIRVDGKAGERQVPLRQDLCQRIRKLGDRNYVWVGRWGPMTVYGLKLLVVRLFGKAGIDGPKASAHTLRHSFSTWYIRNGGHVVQLQQILGHADLSTTMIYVDLAARDVIQDHARHSPTSLWGRALVKPVDVECALCEAQPGEKCTVVKSTSPFYGKPTGTHQTRRELARIGRPCGRCGAQVEKACVDRQGTALQAPHADRADIRTDRWTAP